jgi:hypothetical protein
LESLVVLERFDPAARKDPFVFSDLAIGPEGERGLEAALAGCNFALYVKQPAVLPAGDESRLAIVNDPYAANHMTPRMFGLFEVFTSRTTWRA